MNEKLERKYKEYKQKAASEWVFCVSDDGQYCRIDGIDDKNREITMIGLDYEGAKLLRSYLDGYIKEFEKKQKRFADPYIY